MLIKNILKIKNKFYRKNMLATFIVSFANIFSKNKTIQTQEKLKYSINFKESTEQILSDITCKHISFDVIDSTQLIARENIFN